MKHLPTILLLMAGVTVHAMEQQNYTHSTYQGMHYCGYSGPKTTTTEHFSQKTPFFKKPQCDHPHIIYIFI